MLLVHERLAELYNEGLKRDLTHEELTEMDMCLKFNRDWVWRMNRLKNLSMIATMTNDNDWLHEICARIEELSITGKEKRN